MKQKEERQLKTYETPRMEAVEGEVAQMIAASLTPGEGDDEPQGLELEEYKGYSW